MQRPELSQRELSERLGTLLATHRLLAVRPEDPEARHGREQRVHSSCAQEKLRATQPEGAAARLPEEGLAAHELAALHVAQADLIRLGGKAAGR